MERSKNSTRWLKEQLNELLATKKFDDIGRMLLSHEDITVQDNNLIMLYYLCRIYEQERKAGQQTVFSKVSSVDELLERYTILKFYLRRIDFGVIDGSLDIFYQFLVWNKVSVYELMQIIDFCVIHKEKVLRIIKGKAKDQDEIQTDRKAGIEREKRNDLKSIANNDSNIEEICFIICTNNQVLAGECIYYIKHLVVPEGIQLNILTVEDACSMTAGYNEAMQCSKAKYKVYLHQDTFIVNPYFIRDCLDIFRNNPQIGLIGNVGVKVMPASGVMWDDDRYGMVYEQVVETKLLSNPIESGQEYMGVEAVDGFLMVTQYDIPWREDLFTKWDFYDCSQSMEFIKKGYQVVVPNMKAPWCIHDCGVVDLSNYCKEKEKYIKEYLCER